MRATVTGNLVRDVELKFTSTGRSVCSFTLADSYRPSKDADEQTVFVDVVLWGTLAENFANSLKKGQRAVCEGRVQQRFWETQDGEKRSKFELIADSAGPDLRWQMAEVHHRNANATPKSGGFDGDSDPF